MSPTLPTAAATVNGEVATVPGITRAIVDRQDRPEEIDWKALVLPKLRDSLREKGIDPDTIRPIGSQSWGVVEPRG